MQLRLKNRSKDHLPTLRAQATANCNLNVKRCDFTCNIHALGVEMTCDNFY